MKLFSKAYFSFSFVNILSGLWVFNCIVEFSWFLDFCGILGNVKEKPTRKTRFFCEKKRIGPHIDQSKFCLTAFL